MGPNRKRERHPVSRERANMELCILVLLAALSNVVCIVFCAKKVAADASLRLVEFCEEGEGGSIICA